MRHSRAGRWSVLLLSVASLPFVACAQSSTGGTTTPAVQVEAPGAAGVSRVVVTEKAAERLAIRTAPVREEHVARKRTVGGEVIGWPAGPATGTGALVRVRLTEGDAEKVDRSRPARVLPLERRAGRSAGSPTTVLLSSAAGLETAGVEVRPVGPPAGGDVDGGAAALYYAADGTGHGLAPAQRVLVELPLGESGMRKVVPYSAVLYDLKGEAWVYTSSQPRAFVRQRVSVDYIEGDLAVLLEGPPAGTAIVTIAAPELYGAETGIGKK